MTSMMSRTGAMSHLRILSQTRMLSQSPDLAMESGHPGVATCAFAQSCGRIIMTLALVTITPSSFVLPEYAASLGKQSPFTGPFMLSMSLALQCQNSFMVNLYMQGRVCWICSAPEFQSCSFESVLHRRRLHLQVLLARTDRSAGMQCNSKAMHLKRCCTVLETLVVDVVDINYINSVVFACNCVARLGSL